ncbi:MAG: hypothetical protein JWP25_4343 [Bradyrhizobium sp.]|nr:hypothetical protein [Bradyrhizobium sp.]
MLDAIHCLAVLTNASCLIHPVVTCPVDRSRILIAHRYGQYIQMICMQRRFPRPDRLLGWLAAVAQSETGMTFGRPISKRRIASLEFCKTNSLFPRPTLEAPDHRKQRQCIGLTHLPGVIGQECPPPRGFFDRSLDCTEVMIVRTR